MLLSLCWTTDSEQRWVRLIYDAKQTCNSYSTDATVRVYRLTLLDPHRELLEGRIDNRRSAIWHCFLNSRHHVWATWQRVWSSPNSRFRRFCSYGSLFRHASVASAWTPPRSTSALGHSCVSLSVSATNCREFTIYCRRLLDSFGYRRLRLGDGGIIGIAVIRC
jgi:hypothetical protein